LDAYVRRPQGHTRIIGTLLGWKSEGSIVDITDSFPVVHRDVDDTVLLDQEYQKQMLLLRQRVAPREEVVGWFSTGDEINHPSAVIHGFYCTKESHFQPTAMLPGPVHMLVDTNPVQETFKVKAFVNVRTVVAESLLQFHEVPLRVQTSSSEKAGISQLMHARRASREASRTEEGPRVVPSIDGFTGGLKELLGLFRRMQEYVRAVRADKIEGDLCVGRGLTTSLCSEPVIDAEAIESMCSSNLQDALMVVYLSKLTRTQIAIAEKITSQVGEKAPGV